MKGENMITELEKMERAKMYIDKMSEGINPVTNTYAGENDTINNERISRCLSYVSEILGKVIANDGKVGKSVKANRNRFFITDEQRKKFSPRTKNCFADDIAQDINAITKENNTTKFHGQWIREWLYSIGMMISSQQSKTVTEAGEAVGIISEQRYNDNKGEYYVSVFTPEAQIFIMDNIETIIAHHYRD